MRSLVIGGDYAVRELLRELLTPFGPCQAQSCADDIVDRFAQALEQRQFYDLLVCDTVPRLQGRPDLLLQTVCALRTLEAKAGLPPCLRAGLLVVGTFRELGGILSMVEGQGPAQFLRKPFDEDALLRALERLDLP